MSSRDATSRNAERNLAAKETPDAIGMCRMRVGIHETIVWVNVIVALPRSDRSGCFGGAAKGDPPSTVRNEVSSTARFS